MWTLVIFAVCMIGLTLLVLKITSQKRQPKETYVCDICGEKDCICHKEDADAAPS